eukprot:g3919.t1
MKSLKIIIGLLLVGAALYVVVQEQLTGASANAFINARLTTIRAPIAGELNLTSRPLGAQVGSGDPLGSVEDPLVDSIRLADLEREQSEANSEITRLQSTVSAFDREILELQTRAGIYREERNRQLQAQSESAEAATAAAEARLKYAELALRRSSRLNERGIRTGEAFEQSQSLAEVSALEVRSAQSEAAETAVAIAAADRGVFLGDGYNDAPYSEQRISEINVQRLELQAQLDAKRSSMAAMTARVANERLRVNRLSAAALEANVNGALWDYLAASGERVQRGQDVLKLVDCDSAIVTLSVSESVYNTLRVGTSATFRLIGRREVLRGTVIRLAGAGAATVYQNLAIAPSEQHLQRFDVALDVPALREQAELRCLIGRTGREVERFLGWWRPAKDPKVAIMIATYNEDRAVLERTIVGAKASDHSNCDVLVLDDGRRDWLRDFSEGLGVRYVRRPDNKGSKAGNINHALGLLAQQPDPPDFVAVLDADFVPHADFIPRALALFHQADVGLVQTPQHFFNPDPIQHNLGLSRSYPDEQRFFFDHLQPSRDAWGIAFCCGTSSVIRWQALQAAGGFPTDSITEDFMLTLALQELGFRTVYLNEALTEGLAPEGLKEYVTQRARWCLGLMQIARGRLGPLARNNLRLRDRWSVLDSVFFWLTTFTFRIASMTFPLLYWFFNVTVVNASVSDVISYFGTYMIWILFVLNFLSSGMVIPIVNDVSQLLGAIPISRAAIVGLVKPKGHPFSVTAKGGDRTKVIIQWRLMRPFLILAVLTVIGMFIGIFSDRFAFNDAGDGKVVILFWTVYNLVILGVTLAVCIELPRVERHFADRPERIVISVNGTLKRVWMTDLTQETARIRGVDLGPASRVIMKIKEIGDFPATVLEPTSDGAVVSLGLKEDQYQALLRRLYAGGDVPSVTATRLSAILRDTTARLTRR